MSPASGDGSCPPAATAATKTVYIYGRAFTVSGDPGDDYFRHLGDGTDLTDGVLSALRPHVAPDAVCLDVGANIGLYTLGLASLAPAGQVHSFEPSPTAAGHLARNVSENGAANVTVSDLAVSDTSGTVEFHDFSFFSAGSFASPAGSLLSSEAYGSRSLRLRATTLDDYVADSGLDRVDVVKVDVEGAELSVLAGADKTLATWRPVTVLEFSTFALTIHQGVLPQAALARIREVFPHVFVLDRVDGGLARLETAREAYEFLYDNGIHGPADNLLCTFDDLQVTRRYAPCGARQAAAGAGAEAEAMRRTLSWRVTAPLRRARARLDPVIARATAARRWMRG